MRPDILFILAEDMTLDLGCFGRTDVQTPNIDRLASEGVVYTNARCVAPLSSPTRSAMMTGLHHEITASHNHRSHRDRPLPENIVPFPVLLRQAGYTTVLGHAAAFENPVTHADHESSRKIDCNFRYEPTGAYDGKTQFGLFDRLYERPAQGPWFQQVTLYVTHRGDWWKSIRQQSAHPVDASKVNLPPYLADHLPAIRKGTVDLTEADVLRRSEVPIYYAGQDKEVHNGKLYYLAGLKNKKGLRDPARNNLRAIAVLDLKTLKFEKEIRLDFYDCEPEGIEFIGDDMYLTYYKDALYKVIYE